MPRPETQSFSVFSATVVVAACDDWLLHIQKEADDSMEDFILELMNRKRSLLDPFFRAPRTREEAIQRIKNDPDHFCHWIPMITSGNSSRVKALRSLAAAAMAHSQLAPINVCARDAKILGESLLPKPHAASAMSV